jgi:hypothetical protein
MRTSDSQRLSELLAAGDRTRQVVITFDKRDKPPWTAELHIDGKLVGLRAAASLTDAISKVQATDPRKVRRRASAPIRS